MRTSEAAASSSGVSRNWNRMTQSGLSAMECVFHSEKFMNQSLLELHTSYMIIPADRDEPCLCDNLTEQVKHQN